jgi:hypothetical protein
VATLGDGDGGGGDAYAWAREDQRKSLARQLSSEEAGGVCSPVATLSSSTKPFLLPLELNWKQPRLILLNRASRQAVK